MAVQFRLEVKVNSVCPRLASQVRSGPSSRVLLHPVLAPVMGFACESYPQETDDLTNNKNSLPIKQLYNLFNISQCTQLYYCLDSY